MLAECRTVAADRRSKRRNDQKLGVFRTLRGLESEHVGDKVSLDWNALCPQ